MRIIKNEEKVVLEKTLKSITCNCCGKEFEPEQSDILQEIKLMFSYNSQFDNQQWWRFDICESCILKIIKTFKIVPENFMSDPAYVSASDMGHEVHQRVFDLWKETGEWNWEDQSPFDDEYYEDEYFDNEEIKLDDDKIIPINKYVNYN